MKCAASAGAKMVKEGTSAGIRWAKHQYQKNAQNWNGSQCPKLAEEMSVERAYMWTILLLLYSRADLYCINFWAKVLSILNDWTM